MKDKPIYITFFLLISSLGAFVCFSLYFDFEGFVLYFEPPGRGADSLLGWGGAIVVVVIYSASARKISDVKSYMFKLDALKVVAIVAAVFAGIAEEIIFRKWVMDYLSSMEYGSAVQVIISGLLFGLAHLFWGVKNFAAGVNAAVSTFFLGAGLAVVYLLGGRSLLPCIVAHFMVTALIEPGLIIAAANDKIGYLSGRGQCS